MISPTRPKTWYQRKTVKIAPCFWKLKNTKNGESFNNRKSLAVSVSHANIFYSSDMWSWLSRRIMGGPQFLLHQSHLWSFSQSPSDLGTFSFIWLFFFFLIIKLIIHFIFIKFYSFVQVTMCPLVILFYSCFRKNPEKCSVIHFDFCFKLNL